LIVIGGLELMSACAAAVLGIIAIAIGVPIYLASRARARDRAAEDTQKTIEQVDSKTHPKS